LYDLKIYGYMICNGNMWYIPLEWQQNVHDGAKATRSPIPPPNDGALAINPYGNWTQLRYKFMASLCMYLNIKDLHCLWYKYLVYISLVRMMLYMVSIHFISMVSKQVGLAYWVENISMIKTKFYGEPFKPHGAAVS